MVTKNHQTTSRFKMYSYYSSTIETRYVTLYDAPCNRFSLLWFSSRLPLGQIHLVPTFGFFNRERTLVVTKKKEGCLEPTLSSKIYPLGSCLLVLSFVLLFYFHQQESARSKRSGGEHLPCLAVASSSLWKPPMGFHAVAAFSWWSLLQHNHNPSKLIESMDLTNRSTELSHGNISILHWLVVVNRNPWCHKQLSSIVFHSL